MCGATVRLEHMKTGKNLHSHNVKSPISGKQEISAFGDDGFGDEDDNWQLECVDPESWSGALIVNTPITGASVL